MNIVFDIEANGLKPTHVWVVVCHDLATGHKEIFRSVTEDDFERQRLLEYSKRVKTWIGHNILAYDLPVLDRLLGHPIPGVDRTVDTFVISKMADYPRDGHSIEDYGKEFGIEKSKWIDYTKYSLELEERCIVDVNINIEIYKKYKRYIDNIAYKDAIHREHKFQYIVNNLETKGFMLDTNRVNKILHKVTTELDILDRDILDTFHPKLKPIRVVTPKETKHGTISLSSIPKDLRQRVCDLSVGAPFTHCHWVVFNPASHKQTIAVLTEAGWQPTDKTKAHLEAERRYLTLKRKREDIPQELEDELKNLASTGFKINEANLSTLPPSAPKPATLLAKRILYESRRRTLTEWSGLVEDDGRVHGRFQGIGAWTHRMSHQKPNMANVTNEFDTNGKVKLLGKELRQCWTVPKNRLLVGVDAEGIQLRIFAHLIDDPEFTEALVKGKKSDKTDPHSLNQRIIGSLCKTRQAAKRFIYALLLGAGLRKLAEILECSEAEAREALDRILRRYSGWAKLKEETIPKDARRGYFVGLDGRHIRIPGDSQSTREHLWMSGQLQSGEAIVIKESAITSEPLIERLDSFFVDIVHDEFQAETPNDMRIALQVADIIDKAIIGAGEYFKLKCPLAGSYYNDDHKDYTIGRNWYETH